MPKIDIFLNPSEDLPKDLAVYLKKNFSAKELEKLEKFGGRIQVSVTAPFTDRKKQDKSTVIDSKFIQSLSENVKNARDLLNPLTKDQLIEVAKQLKFPVTSKSTTKEIKDSLIRFLDSDRIWLNISGSSSTKK